MEEQYRRNRSRGLFWLILAIITGYLVYLLAPVITPFAVALLIAYVTDPLIDRIERWHIRSWTFGRTLAVVIVFVLLTAMLVISVLIVVPLLVRQFRELVEYVPTLVDWLAHTAVPWVAAKLGLGDLDVDASMVTELAKDYWRELSKAAIDVAGTLGKGGAAVVTLATNLVLIPVVAFYMMRDWDKLLEGIRNLLPRKVVGSVTDIAAEINEVLGAFLRGQLLVMLALGVLYSSGLALVGLNMAFLIGMGAGLLSIVPYLGLAIGMIVAVTVAIFQFGDILHVVLVGVVFAVSQSIESMYLTPKLVGDRIGLHPVVVIFAILAGGQLFGFLGILLALPVSAALNVVVRHAQEIYQSSYLYRD